MRILSILSVILFILFNIFVFIRYKQVNPGVDIKEFNPYIQNALNIKMESIASLANISIMLLSGVWGLFFAKKLIKTKLSIKITLIIGSLFLVLSYWIYKIAIGYYIGMLKINTIDINAPRIIFLENSQLIGFCTGFIISGASLFFAEREMK